MANWYVSSVGWTAVAQWATATSYNVGDFVRPKTAPAVAAQRVFRCTTAGLSAAITEPTWPTTNGGTFTENSGTTNVPIWTEVTGLEARNTTTFAAPAGNLQTMVVSGWTAAGDTVFVASNHAETQGAAANIIFPGTRANPNRIICIAATHSNTPVAADLATTGTITCTGNFAMSLRGSFYCYGLTFAGGSGANSPNFNINPIGGDIETFDTCGISMPATSGGSMLLGSSNAGTTLDNTRFLGCTVTFGAASQVLNPRSGNFDWIGGALAGTVPTGLFGDTGLGDGGQAIVNVRDVNLNSAGTWTSKFLVNQGAVEGGLKWRFVNCKVATTLGGVVTGTSLAGTEVHFVSSDSTSNKTYREEHYAYTGSAVQETTVVRTGGASDGTTSKAWKIVSLSTASAVFPFYCPDIYQWVNSTGSKTVSIYFANNSSVTAQDLDIGFEVEYLGDSGSPLGTFSDTRPSGALALLSTGTNWSTDGSTWGGSTTTKQVMTKTITINQVGVIRIRPFIAKASFTVYIDPLTSVA